MRTFPVQLDYNAIAPNCNGVARRPTMSGNLTTLLLSMRMLYRDGSDPGAISVANTLPIAETIHQALVSKAAKGKRIDCPELTGHEINGQPLSDQHRHAHVLPVDLDGDGLLDHVIIHAPMGLGDIALHGILALRWLYGNVRDTRGRNRQKTDFEIALRSVGFVGSNHGRLRRQCDQGLDNASSIDAADGLPREVQRLVPGSNGARIWKSLTPFIAPRFLKKSGKNSLLGQINSELTLRCLPELAEIELLDDESAAMRPFKRVRQKGGSPPPQNWGYALSLVLTEPAFGPLSLGYASHFGLGLFAATDCVIER